MRNLCALVCVFRTFTSGTAVPGHAGCGVQEPPRSGDGTRSQDTAAGGRKHATEPRASSANARRCSSRGECCRFAAGPVGPRTDGCTMSHSAPLTDTRDLAGP
eukprot:4126835-Prymnesium_polylepis.1